MTFRKRTPSAIAAALAGTCVLAACGVSSVSASQVAASAGASSCDKSDYYLIIKTTGEHDTIYDCTFPSGVKCVTYENGIANDATEAVRLVFSTTLGTAKPSCLQ